MREGALRLLSLNRGVDYMKVTWIAAAAAASLVSQPVLAAEAFRDGGVREQRTGAFAGVNFKVPLGSKQRVKPSARLQLTTSRESITDGGYRSVRPAGLELGLTGKGEADVFLGGNRLSDTDRKLGLTGMGDWVLPVALLAAVVVGVVLLTESEQELPNPPPQN